MVPFTEKCPKYIDYLSDLDLQLAVASPIATKPHFAFRRFCWTGQTAVASCFSCRFLTV